MIVSQVIAPERVNLNLVFEAFGNTIKHVTLGFTPLEPEQYEESEITDPDNNLFVMGKATEEFQSQKLMIPVLAYT